MHSLPYPVVPPLGHNIDRYITRHNSATRQITKQTFTTSKHAIEYTYSDFPCHLKVNRDKLALTYRRWMCKRSKRLTITVDF